MISDDELLLYYYRDGLDAADRARIGEALSQSPELAQRLHKLASRLDAVAAIPEVPVPNAVQQRWRAALDTAAASPTTTSATPVIGRTRMYRWFATAAVVLITVVLVVQFGRQPQLSGAKATPPASAYERGLQSHLANTESQLASLEAASPEDRVRLVQTIIEQNRLYALAAERAGEPQLARVLRAFSPVLENAARGGTDTSASVAQLAFELRVMQSRLAADTASPHQPTTL